MMPQINISQSLYDKIKGIAEPFVDTPESVITRCVEHYVSTQLTYKGAANASAMAGGPNLAFAPDAPPDLTFTKILAAKLDGIGLNKSSLYWNTLMCDIVARAAKLAGKDKLKEMLLINYVSGEGPSAQGYRFVPAANLSVQGQDANAAWKATFHIVKSLGMKIDVTFMWENKDKALHPGKTGQMTFEQI